MHGVASHAAYKCLTPIIDMLEMRHYKTEGERMEDDLEITVVDCLQGMEQMMGRKLLRLGAIDIDTYRVPSSGAVPHDDVSIVSPCAPLVIF